VNVAALLLPFVVALPPGAAAPPPGAVPRAAQVTVLDRELGLVAVRLPKRGLALSLRRLRAAPGVRYVERDAPITFADINEGCGGVGSDAPKPFPGWRTAIHLTRRSAAGVLVGIADSGVDDDRLAPMQSPLLKLAAGGAKRPQDPTGHGTAVGSLLVANRPDVAAVGMVPDATLLSARILRPTSCSPSVLSQGLIAAFGWLRTQGAQVVNVSATAVPSRALIDSLRALQLSGALVVAAVGNAGGVAPRELFPASQSGVLGVGALAPRSSTEVWKGSTRGPQVDLVAPAEGMRVVASRSVSVSKETAMTPAGTSFAAPLVTGTAAMVWATHRDWSAAEVANAIVRSATPLRRGPPNPDSGAGRLDVRHALRVARVPDPHEPNDWVAAALGQRPLHPGAIVVASLGYAGDRIDAYTVDVPAGTKARAVLRKGGAGVTLRSLSVKASDALLTGVARERTRPTAQIALPTGRSLLVVTRNRGQGTYTLALSGT
jgi:Subtilase family